MNKEPDMTDEELKDLAKVQYWQSDATYAALAVQAHHASEKAKAHLLAYIENERPTQRQADVIAALDALILKPPVDPVVALFREAFAGSEVNNLGGYWSVERRFRELVSKRGLELRTVADGGGA